jgi:hypothetical protein
MTTRQKDKWNSRRWQVTVWAVLSVTLIITYSLYKQLELGWITNTITLLLVIPSAFIGSESYLKPKIGAGKDQNQDK